MSLSFEGDLKLPAIGCLLRVFASVDFAATFLQLLFPDPDANSTGSCVDHPDDDCTLLSSVDGDEEGEEGDEDDDEEEEETF